MVGNWDRWIDLEGLGGRIDEICSCCDETNVAILIVVADIVRVDLQD